MFLVTKWNDLVLNFLMKDVRFIFKKSNYKNSKCCSPGTSQIFPQFSKSCNFLPICFFVAIFFYVIHISKVHITCFKKFVNIFTFPANSIYLPFLRFTGQNYLQKLSSGEVFTKIQKFFESGCINEEFGYILSQNWRKISNMATSWSSCKQKIYFLWDNSF